MLRPVEIDKVFTLAIDAYTCLWGGLISPRLCLKELNEKIGDTDLLISLGSSISEDTHLSKQNYFNISLSDNRVREVGIIGSCMITVFSYEHLKNHPKFENIKALEIVQFLRHLRNAAAHGNRFCFINSKSKRNIDPGNISWRSKHINKSLEDNICFPDFFPHGDLAYLLEDITKLLK